MSKVESSRGNRENPRGNPHEIPDFLGVVKPIKLTIDAEATKKYIMLMMPVIESSELEFVLKTYNQGRNELKEARKIIFPALIGFLKADTKEEKRKSRIIYEKGFIKLIDASRLIAIWKLIVGKKLTDLAVEQGVYDEWEPWLIEQGLSQAEAHEYVRKSIDQTKDVQRREGVTDYLTPETGLQARYRAA